MTTVAKRINYSFSFGIFIVVLIVGYFLFYKPYENKIAYQQNIVCSNLVAKTEANNEAAIAKYWGNTNGWIFGSPQSHFNQRLNTCLGDFSENLSTYTKTTGDITFNYSIQDVISGKTVVSSVIDSVTSRGVSTTTLFSGVSKDEFTRQEKILMSE